MWKNYTVIILTMPVHLWEYFTIVILLQNIVYHIYWSIFFIATIIFIYPQKIVETIWDSNVFRRNRKEQFTWTGLHSTDFYSTWNKTIKPYPGDSRNTNSSNFEKIQLSVDLSLLIHSSKASFQFRFYFEVDLNGLKKTSIPSQIIDDFTHPNLLNKICEIRQHH